jgi:ABC-2 type transport system ATP-binding protein
VQLPADRGLRVAVPDVVEVRGLCKAYGDVQAVGGIDFSVHEGEIFALLGPNGAGKTTTVEILEGYRNRDAGDVRVLDFDPATGGSGFRDRIGIVLQAAGIELQLTVGEALRQYASYYSRPRDAEELSALVGLDEKFHSRVGNLSGGQRRRLDLALALVGHPEVIFLDEPTTGFDPEARRRSWELIASLRQLGTTIVLTSHYMDEVERLADRLVVIMRGRIVASGAPAELMAGPSATRISFRLPAGVDATELPHVDGEACAALDGSLTWETAAPTALLHALTRWAVARGVELDGLTVTRPSLEDIYLALTDRAGEDVT